MDTEKKNRRLLRRDPSAFLLKYREKDQDPQKVNSDTFLIRSLNICAHTQIEKKPKSPKT